MKKTVSRRLTAVGLKEGNIREGARGPRSGEVFGVQRPNVYRMLACQPSAASTTS